VVDGASNGRGAWLCRAPDTGLAGLVVSSCLDAALGRKAFAKAWRMPVDTDDEEAIRHALEHERQG
jgi:predicted RNA-binding protein YlxR (DUF448 family)